MLKVNRIHSKLNEFENKYLKAAQSAEKDSELSDESKVESEQLTRSITQEGSFLTSSKSILKNRSISKQENADQSVTRSSFRKFDSSESEVAEKDDSVLESLSTPFTRTKAFNILENIKLISLDDVPEVAKSHTPSEKVKASKKEESTTISISDISEDLETISTETSPVSVPEPEAPDTKSREETVHRSEESAYNYTSAFETGDESQREVTNSNRTLSSTKGESEVPTLNVTTRSSHSRSEKLVSVSDSRRDNFRSPSNYSSLSSDEALLEREPSNNSREKSDQLTKTKKTSEKEKLGHKPSSGKSPRVSESNDVSEGGNEFEKPPLKYGAPAEESNKNNIKKVKEKMKNRSFREREKVKKSPTQIKKHEEEKKKSKNYSDRRTREGKAKKIRKIHGKSDDLKDEGDIRGKERKRVKTRSKGGRTELKDVKKCGDGRTLRQDVGTQTSPHMSSRPEKRNDPETERLSHSLFRKMYGKEIIVVKSENEILETSMNQLVLGQLKFIQNVLSMQNKLYSLSCELVHQMS